MTFQLNLSLIHYDYTNERLLNKQSHFIIDVSRFIIIYIGELNHEGIDCRRRSKTGRCFGTDYEGTTLPG